MKELLNLGKRLSKSEQSAIRGGCYIICYWECDGGGPLSSNDNDMEDCTQTCVQVC